MLFKGRVVVGFMGLTMAASVLVTLLLAGHWPSLAAGAVASRAEQGPVDHEQELSPKEIEKLNTVLELIEQKYYTSTDRETLVDGALEGMIRALGDPYSTYMEQQVAEQFSDSVQGSFSGVGAKVTMENGHVVVVSAIKNSPAQRAGLQAKDIILSVNGESLEGIDLKDVIMKLRGPKGSQAKVEIRREGHAQPLQLVLVREDIDVETVYSSLQPSGVGVIEIHQFSLNTAERFAEELGKLEKQGMKALLIDVRDNPGGVLPVVERIAEQFIPSGKTIVQVQYRTGSPEPTISKGKGKSYPLAVLMNKGSASASEILAASLKESAGAVLIGETSYGKGTVQVSYDKNLNGDLVKMTIAKWLTPDGNWIHQKGIKPDVQIEPSPLYTVARLGKTAVLQKDTASSEVKSLQTMLLGIGFDPGREDGYYSEKTEQALKNFQSTVGLTPNGIADVQTQQMLEDAVREWIHNDSHDSQLSKALQTLSERIGISH